jgi:DNA mismatch repair protein MutS
LAQPEQQGPREIPLTREEFLRRIYNIQSLLPVRQWLGFRDSLPQERALVSLLRFVEDHLPSAFERLKQNTVWSSRSTLTLGNNAITQLQLTAPRVQDSVLGLFRSAITPMGRRGLRERLLIPTADGELIQRRLSEVAAAVEATHADEIQPALRLLRMIYDLPRLHRRIDCYEISAPDILALNQSYLAAEELASTMTSLNTLTVLSPRAGMIEQLSQWRRQTFETAFSIQKAASASDDLTFLETTTPETSTIRSAETEIAEIRAAVQEFVDHCRRISGSSGEAISIESKREEPFAVSGTPQSIKSLQKNISAADVIPAFKEVAFKHQKSGGWVECPWLTVQNHRVLRLREKLRSEFLKVLPGICLRVSEAAGGLWATLEAWIENFDITQCLAREAVGRGWCRPQILPYDTDRGSSVAIKGLRHPLIESIITRTEYVKHNVSLGSDGPSGWLVYGMNASGKSSLMKAIGIAVHLAQAGSFVPASEMSLAPFKAIYTRILNQDNLWAGLSSFAVEMSEMRDILTAAGPNTLVLGDELCAGTESVSAQALVAAGIKWLAERRARYVFATHLHGLLDLLPEPAELSLQVWHLRVAFDPVRDILIYERHLRPGAGSSLYGLEVARAMHLPVDFLEVAQGLRRKLLGTAVEEEAPQSDWNSAITRRTCESCGTGMVADLEVHHIRGRAEAGGAKHFADGEGRDDARNLMVVCQRCHDDHHAGRIEFGRVVQTSAGPVRQITIQMPAAAAPAAQAQAQDTKPLQQPTPKSLNVLVNKLPEEPLASNSKKWTPEEQATILDFVKKHAHMTAKQSVFFLHCNYKIDISEATLRKIKKNGSF